MSQYTSYYLYQKYQKIGTDNWVPVTPNTFSVDGDGTMPLSAKTENDPECGYSPTPSELYRWVNMDISTNWVCDGYFKYYKQKKQVSYDSGVIWQDVIPYEYRKGSLYESYSSDCGAVTIERWVNSGTTCLEYDKYYLQVKQISYDGGVDWITTSDYQLGDLIQRNSPDCGYVPPTFEGKFKATYSGGTTYSAECDSSSAVTSADTRPSGYQYSAMTDAVIGNCSISIGEMAFYFCSSLTSVTIPTGVTYIGDEAFLACYSLTSVTIPNSVTSIGYTAFAICRSLTSVTIGSGVTSIGRQIFYQCYSLTSIGSTGSGASVEIPNSVTSIGGYAFSDCTGLTSITIPNSITSIGNGAFAGCSSLTSIGSTGSGTSVEIPNSVTNIVNAFSYCSGLTSIVIPDSVTTIGYDAFAYCTILTSVTIGSGVTIIDDMAFRECHSLSSITINATTPPTLGNNVFHNTNDCPIYVPANSVSTYKSASGWSTYASRIQAIT